MRTKATMLSILAMLACLVAPRAWAQDKPCARPGITPLKPIMSTHTIPPYPEVSVMTSEQGTTLLEVGINTEGVVDDIQIVKSSGSLRLDEAARDHVKATWRWEPMQQDCQPRRVRTRVSIAWDLRDAPAENGPQPPVLVMTKGDYPAGALARKEQGSAVIKMYVLPKGELASLGVTQSSGFPELDARSQDVVRSHKWFPMMLDGKPVATLTFVVVTWQLDDVAH
jgi:TonB family protein